MNRVLFRQKVALPIPESITLELPSLRPVRLELVNEAGRPVKPVMLLVELVGDRSAETLAVLQTDDQGAAFLELPSGRRELRLMVLQSGQVARRPWNGEAVVRLTLPEPAELDERSPARSE